jgi:hypothetical protein
MIMQIHSLLERLYSKNNLLIKKPLNPHLLGRFCKKIVGRYVFNKKFQIARCFKSKIGKKSLRK